MRHLWLLLIAVCLMLSSDAYTQTEKKEQATPEPDRTAENAHSFMELFTKLERDWMLAVQHRDRTALESLIAPEFVARNAHDPGESVVRAAWIDKALQTSELRSFEISNMAIRSFRGNAVVSFEERQQLTTKGTDQIKRYFIVEVWVANRNRWQAASRFTSEICQ
jgi:Domain of unknown function (DUF4440)